MTINDVLTEVDELKPNVYDDAIKIRWISTLEGRIIHEVFDTHEHDMEINFNGYTINDINEDLLVEDTYADLYKFYVFAMIDANNGEASRYATSMTLFNDMYRQYSNHFNKTHMPIGKPLKLF